MPVSLLGSLLWTPVEDRTQMIIAMVDKYCISLAEVVEEDGSVLRPRSRKARVEPS
ncbi:hypothetical protein BT96DRAFT_982174 [Gymnopus androsaceus JB14]|uniref:Uncharacterized protein n=1 Tax=Gymnopus androsaceus JB14 TaxID=1447944 RepID=A0A6A4GH79_9AGAR|nr:hypothetical protein BT96DRAFT_982174 [Gymnopus androsaceus JB14]